MEPGKALVQAAGGWGVAGGAGQLLTRGQEGAQAEGSGCRSVWAQPLVSGHLTALRPPAEQQVAERRAPSPSSGVLPLQRGPQGGLGGVLPARLPSLPLNAGRTGRGQSAARNFMGTWRLHSLGRKESGEIRDKKGRGDWLLGHIWPTFPGLNNASTLAARLRAQLPTQTPSPPSGSPASTCPHFSQGPATPAPRGRTGQLPLNSRDKAPHADPPAPPLEPGPTTQAWTAPSPRGPPGSDLIVLAGSLRGCSDAGH